ncbi:putative GNAT family acetyltransferase [Sphingobium fontiphilum]|uniref:Putative GNAT family acetyltransferase n=1 Tax=Sphingobium fontiphilum TaxID=944425 RepID=A0A7W6DQU4_9SPHN|nr:GNAT family N-acetyltransferase [Sphingobium fontiphilum]MBB3983489.1 putative GNAT family acetyltransferase [Sphingobium fontiphilum]
MSPHPLDRPVWNALNSHWSPLAEGDGTALRLNPDHGPFAAAADNGAAARAALAALTPATDELWTVEREQDPPLPGVHVVRQAALAQMVATDLPTPTGLIQPIELTEEDAPAMRELALMTKPGPFRPFTHRLGRFIGIRQDGRLVAMAGERLRLPGFAEVSGVCTHPDYRGRGHASALMLIVAHAMRQRGETPFLHAYAAHEGTIALYEKLGFRRRATMHMMVFAR